VLVARGIDGLLVGWLAVIVWLAVYLVHRIAPSASLPGISAVYWTGVVLTAAHFGCRTTWPTGKALPPSAGDPWCSATRRHYWLRCCSLSL